MSSVYPQVIPSAPPAEVVFQDDIKFHGYTNGQQTVLVIATVAAVALTAIAFVFGGPIAGIGVGILAGLAVVLLAQNFKERNLDYEYYRRENNLPPLDIHAMVILPRPIHAGVIWGGRVRVSSLPSRPINAPISVIPIGDSGVPARGRGSSVRLVDASRDFSRNAALLRQRTEREAAHVGDILSHSFGSRDPRGGGTGGRVQVGDAEHRQ